MTKTFVSRPLRRLVLGALLTAAAGLAQAQEAPLRLLVGFPPGGGSDAIARVLAEKLKDQLNRPVVVENRAGAGGQLAAQALKAAPPDGSTLFLSHDHSISIIPLVLKNAGYGTADFVPVAGFATFANVLALSGGTPARTLPDYVAWVKSAKAGKDTIGVPAPASIPEFLVGLVGRKYGLDLQSAPYRGSAPMMADMLGDQIAAGVAGVPDFIENQKAGKIRIVAVMGDKRQPLLPEVPTFRELGLAGLEDLPYYGLFAPAGTPPAAVDRAGQALSRVLALPDVRERLTAMGLTVGYQPHAQFTQRVRTYTQAWERIIKESGFQPK